jgi:NADPH:quinone reductase-like Zn-dependent oxidoreductase
MRGAVLYAFGDVRVEERQDPGILAPTDAVIRLPATCVCGSDLWPYRGIEAVDGPSPMGHEYVGIVQEVGSEVSNIKPGRFVVGSFFASDNTCEICQAGYQSSCLHREPIGAIGAQAQYLRVPWPTAPGRHPGHPVGRAGPELAGRLRRARHRLVRRRGRRGRPGQDRRGWSVTARSGCWPCWPPPSSAPSASSR